MKKINIWGKRAFLAVAGGLVICFGLALASGAWAAVGPSDRLREDEILRGHFVEEHVMGPLLGGAKAAPQTVRTEGSFLVAPGRGVLWQVRKPLPVTLVLTKLGVEQSVAGVPLLRMTSAQMAFLGDASRLLVQALGGDWKGLETDFAVTPSGKPARWSVKLVPRKESDARALFASMLVKGGRLVEGADVTGRDGRVYKFEFSSIAKDKEPLAEDETLLFDQATMTQGS